MIYKYEVTVGNVGSVYRGASKKEATKSYLEMVAKSLSDSGRASGEEVILWEDGEPIAEHQGSGE